MPGGCNCRNESRPVNDDGAEIIDLGCGRPGLRTSPSPLKKPADFVVGEKGGRIEAEFPGALASTGRARRPW